MPDRKPASRSPWRRHCVRCERNTNHGTELERIRPKCGYPRQVHCEDSNQSPPLAWSGVACRDKKPGADCGRPRRPDPAAPKMTWVHWVLYNLPPGTTGLEAGTSRATTCPPERAKASTTGSGKATAALPAHRRHRYVHKLYALDTVLPVLNPATRAALEKAMQGTSWRRVNWWGITGRKSREVRVTRSYRVVPVQMHVCSSGHRSTDKRQPQRRDSILPSTAPCCRNICEPVRLTFGA